jgi:hypothetical protein
MAVTKITYGTSTAITCTLASLASSATAGRGSAAVDNTSNLFDDALLYIAVKTSASALANDKTCYVYLYGSEDGTNYSGSSAEAEGTDAAVTIDQPSNLILAGTIKCPASSVTYRGIFSVALTFGGIMPRKWGFVLRNYTGQALDSTEGNHTKTYTGVTYTTA